MKTYITCLCGCGINFNKPSRRPFWPNHKQNVKPVDCACGCGEKLIPYDNRDRPRRFITGHGSKGIHNPMYNVPGPGKGKPRSDKDKEAIRQSRLGKPHPINLSKDEIQKRREQMKGNTRGFKKGMIPWNKNIGEGKYKEKMRLMRLNQKFPNKDSKIEIALQDALKFNSIEFELHKPIIGQPDIFIEPNICIFADGEYWHALPKVIDRDKKVNKQLLEHGYIVLRFIETEINKDISSCIYKIRAIVNYYRMIKQVA